MESPTLTTSDGAFDALGRQILRVDEPIDARFELDERTETAGGVRPYPGGACPAAYFSATFCQGSGMVALRESQPCPCRRS